ncbi:MAG: S8 family serine peptidase [Bacteroidales bacterium]|nr:S8 family serine peptidase [Bacteroidales bacterium]
MKTKSLPSGSAFRKILLLMLSFAFPGFIATAQTVYSDYHDGRIYLKYKDNVAIDFEVNPDLTVDISTIPFISALSSEFSLKELSRPFYLNNDGKLLRTLMLEFNDFERVDQIMQRLNQVPLLEYVEKVPLDKIDYVPNDSLYTLYNGPQNWNWHLDRIQADLAWDISHGNSEVRVAIVDNAVWVDHPDLAGKIVAQRDTYYNTNNANPPASGDPYEWSHGTHCAGLAAGASDNGIGVASVGFDVSIIAVKAAANSNASSIYGYTGIQWAANNGADVINMSWGGPGYSQTNQNMINTIFNSGIVLVAAAGNDNVSTPHYPSAYANVISVASTDFNDLKSDFSNFATSVDVSSPGGSAQGGPAGLLSTTYSTATFGNYDLMSGTSMASPIVAGLAGLVLSINQELTPAQVENIIKTTTDDIYPLNPDYTGMLGTGRINAYQAALHTPYSPTANFSTEVTTILPGGSGILFADLSTGVPSQWQWTFEGGNPAASTSQTPAAVRYTTPGVYDVSLTVTNDFGSNTVVFPDYITVTATPVPYVMIGASDSLPCISSPVTLNDLSLYTPTAWEWSISPSSYEFINGSSLNSQNPEVRFMVPGPYSVSLTAWNANGVNSMSFSDFIGVKGAVPSYNIDMENGTPGYFTLWDTIKSQSAVDSRSAFESSKSIHFQGDPIPTGWQGSPTAGTPEQAWNSNKQFHARASICGVDATGMENVALELDLHQTYSLGPRYSWFRVLVNGIQVPDENGVTDFNPTTTGADPWQRLTFDLTAFAGSVFDITLQACNRFSYHVQGEGDNVFIDNISIINTTPTSQQKIVKTALEVYPNPSDGEFTVAAGNLKGEVSIRVYSLLGNIVYSNRYNSTSGTFTRKIDLSDLPAGIYLLSVNSGADQLNQRIVIK